MITSTTVNAIVPIVMKPTVMRCRNTNSSARPYAFVRPSSARSMPRLAMFGVPVVFLSRREHIIGVSVSEMIADRVIDTASVTANSRNRRPTEPPMNNSGMNTASSEHVMLTIVKPICSRP